MDNPLDVECNIDNVNDIRNRVAKELQNSYIPNNNNNNKSNKIFVNGTPVIVNVPKIDCCSKLGFRNVIGIIHKYIPDIDKYEIKTKHGIIKRKLSSDEFEICPNLYVDIEDDDNQAYISLRQVARLDCIKYVGCRCYGKCQHRKCICYKYKKMCGSFCKHKSNRCTNFKLDKVIQTRLRK